ncbi:MAG: tetratricopeptide repeat protein [Promethearchaeota archaeon]|nr:MAG: tetratricopeptide repeat protein [Candidatus Lokiarchaeota archaeon]
MSKDRKKLEHSTGNNLNYKEYFKIGLEYFEKEKYEESIRNYNLAIELNSNRPNIWTNKSLALAKLERYEDANISADRAIRLNPEDYIAWNIKGFSLKKKGSETKGD